MADTSALVKAAPIVAWLHEQALRGADGGAILEGFCERLLSCGFDLRRAVVGYLVFHPQFDAINLTWLRERGKTERQAIVQKDILSVPSPFLLMQSTGAREIRYDLTSPEASLSFPSLTRLQEVGYTDYLAFFQPFGTSADPALWPDLPPGTTMREGISGSFATTHADGFTADEVALLRMLVPPLSGAVKVASILEMAETLLGAYLGATTGRSVLRGQVRRGQGRIIHALVWYSDMRGSTELAETVPLEAYLATLNSYYDCVVDAVDQEGGEVLKFVGDGVLAMFSLDGDAPGRAQVRRAIAAARNALGHLDKVNAERAALGLPEIRCGIALHAGDVMYGNVGTAERLDFTVTGPAVNEAVRLEALCKEIELPLIVSDRVASMTDEPLRPLGPRLLPGVNRTMDVFSPLLGSS